MTSEDIAEWDAELADLLECPDCRGPAAVQSRIDGQTRHITAWQWHERTCPNRSGRLAWSAEAAVSVGGFTWDQTRTTA